MSLAAPDQRIRVAIAGVGNCAGSLIEGLSHYRKYPDDTKGLLFPVLADYSVKDIEVVVAFDISSAKVGIPLRRAIYQQPNNFRRLADLTVDGDAHVFRGPSLDGNPDHLARFVPESEHSPNDVTAILKTYQVDVLVNLLPTGSHQAAEFYAIAACEANCAFINCIPSLIAQRSDIQARFAQRQLPLLGDDIKSQMGTTILHRALLHLAEMRGATLLKSSQINIGGNTDFANFVHRADSKLVSKRKSLARYIGDAESHVGHHYDPTKGAFKDAMIEIDVSVFAGSSVKVSVRLQSDDKPNSAGSVVDLIRIAKGSMDRGQPGSLSSASAFYMKSPPTQVDDFEAMRQLVADWTSATPARDA